MVIDIETAGVDPLHDALLEIAAFPILRDAHGFYQPGEPFSCHVLPFEGANIDPRALEVNRIDPYHPFRFAIDEKKALQDLFTFIDTAISTAHCRRAVLVGHNAHFDLSFIRAAMKRSKMKKSPLHAFTCFDTATLSGMAFGKTILANALSEASIPFNKDEAHSAIYDAKCTAELFCYITNRLNLSDSDRSS